LARLTANRFTAAIAGTIVTAVIHSSSVTTVLVVGFISAGLLNLSQSVGVIIGANIGTTITAQIIAFKIYKYGLLMIALGGPQASRRHLPDCQIATGSQITVFTASSIASSRGCFSVDGRCLLRPCVRDLAGSNPPLPPEVHERSDGGRQHQT
jgi:hypothetical protein